MSAARENPSRRRLLAAAGLLAVPGLTGARGAAAASTAAPAAASGPKQARIEPFGGAHQGGIITPQQKHTCFAAFDLVAKQPGELVALLRAWTLAASRMAIGQTAGELGGEPDRAPADGGAALGLEPARLTLTFGFGPGMFTRYGLERHRPEALVELPKFNGDQLDPARSGGDISVQACADDPQVAFHAVRELGRLGYGRIRLRWNQTGFVPDTAPGDTPRNLMGFKDGTNNPNPHSPRDFARIASPRSPPDFNATIWVGEEGPPWLRGGSYLVARRIRISLEHWDQTDVAYQEEVVGRRKYSGAPLGGSHEHDRIDLDATDADGNPVIPEASHVRLAVAASNGGALILRRAYSYNDGATLTAERWPPWRQGMMYDAGLFFLAYQRDPRTGFIRIFENMAKLDAMNQFTTHVGGGLFACPGGVAAGEFIGQRLFDAA